MMVVCASERPRSAIISTRSRRLSLNRRYQRTHRRMTSRSKWPVAAHEQLFQALQCQSAPLRYSAFSERPVSIATARTSPDGHLLQLAFEVHGLRGSGRGLDTSMAAMAPRYHRPRGCSNCNQFAAVPCEQHLRSGVCEFDLMMQRCRSLSRNLACRAHSCRAGAQGGAGPPVGYRGLMRHRRPRQAPKSLGRCSKMASQ
jgi:hypothetical protein